MKITRFRFRIFEAVFMPFGFVLADGLMHLCEGKPFMSEYLFGAALAVFIVRSLDAARAYSETWPENVP
jgi:hypothetical protein